jgi:transcriptional regulator with XRE-family HTH domain
MTWEKIFGKNIRRLRKDRGFTQEQLAEEAGMAMRYLSGVERGEENPTLRFMAKIADALGVPLPDLFKRS